MNTPCQDAPEMWVSDHIDARREAAALCQGCPVVAQCYEQAMTGRVTFGVWGGVDFSRHETRPKFPPKPKRIKHGTEGGYQAHIRAGQKPCGVCVAGAREAWRTYRARTAGRAAP